MWDAANGTMLAKLQGHRGIVKQIAWSPDGRRLASCGGAGGGELLIWDAHSGACLSELERARGNHQCDSVASIRNDPGLWQQ